MALRARATATVGGAAAAGAAAAVAAPSDALLWGAAIGIALLLLVGGFFSVRYRGELRRLVPKRKEP
jgi:hypothetical protein